MKKRVKIFLTVVVCVLVFNIVYQDIKWSTTQSGIWKFVLNTQSEETKNPTIEKNSLYAKAAILMDGETGRVLFGKNEEEQLANASTTKILTAIIALENTALDSVCTASENAATQPKVHLGVVKNEKIKLQHLLYSLMLESHNDSAVMIAEGVAGTKEAFADMMNKKAEEIGCENSYFITPNGLDSVDEKGKHHTTAKDLALILRYCILQSEKKKEFITICSTLNYTFSDETGHHTYQCHNHNALMNQMDGVIAGKTGFTGDAGYCYVGAVENEGRKYIVALLACGWPNNKNYKWKDARKLLDFGMQNYHIQNVKIEEIELLPTIEMREWANENYELGVSKTIYPEIRDGNLSILISDWEKLSVTYQLPEQMNHKIEKNTLAGYASVYIDGKLFDKKEVTYIETLNLKNFYWYFQAICKIWMQK